MNKAAHLRFEFADEIEAASSIELGSIPFVTNVSCLYHVYIRGEVYLATGHGSAAAAEFQKIIDHSGMCGTAGREPWRVWAWLAPTHCSREPRRERMPMPLASGRSPPTKIFSPSGKTPSPTSPSRSKRGRSTRSCSSGKVLPDRCNQAFAVRIRLLV